MCNESYKNQKSKWAVWDCYGVVKVGGDKCLKYLTNIFNDLFFKDKLPEKWMLSSLVQILKGKGDPLNPKIRSCFLYLLTSKRLLIWCQGKLFVLL